VDLGERAREVQHGTVHLRAGDRGVLQVEGEESTCSEARPATGVSGKKPPPL
jgi:hypothetical protein